MTSISEWEDELDNWCPAFIVIAIFIVLLPIRMLVCLMLPGNSGYEWHPLHKVKRFWGFE